MTEIHYTVGEVARLAHVSVRTLHHYDDIGLLTPSDRSAAGYRLYGEADLRRLHEILIFRELGLPLGSIQLIVDSAPQVRAATLREHCGALRERVQRTEAVIRAVEAKLDALERGRTMGTDRMFDGFDSFDHAQYAEEAEQRWGDTDAHRESRRRTKEYSREEWETIRAESDAIMRDWGRLHAAGMASSSAEARAIAERHRLHISRWFYECSPGFHIGLADMYLADRRFGETFEKYGAGLTRFVVDSIRANAEGGTDGGRGG